MTTRSLTTREDDTYVEWRECHWLAWLESDDRHAISVREQLLDLSLIAYRLSSGTFNSLNRTLKSLRKLGLISSTSFLKI